MANNRDRGPKSPKTGYRRSSQGETRVASISRISPETERENV